MLEDDYEDFKSPENIEKSSYMLGSELEKSKFDALLSLVKKYIVDVWETRKHKLYDSDLARIQSTTPFSVFTWGKE